MFFGAFGRARVCFGHTIKRWVLDSAGSIPFGFKPQLLSSMLLTSSAPACRCCWSVRLIGLFLGLQVQQVGLGIVAYFCWARLHKVRHDVLKETLFAHPLCRVTRRTAVLPFPAKGLWY